MKRSLLAQCLIIQAIAAALCLGAEAIAHFALGLRYPYDCPVMVFPGDFFPDFLLLINRIFVHIHTLAFFAPGDHHFMYPPAATLLYEPFALLPPPLRVPGFVAALSLTVLVMAALFARGLTRRGIPTAKAALIATAGVLLSYPIWFEMQRGNTEMFVWAITAAGVWAFYRDKPFLAAACFGVVGAMKLYPGVLFGLLFARRQFRPLLFGVGVAVLISVACLWLEYPNILVSTRETLLGLRTFEFAYIEGRFPPVLSYDHSLLSLYKRAVLPTPERLGLATRLYFRVFALLGLFLYWFRIRKLPMVNQVLALTVATILFPPVSFDYTLLHLYTPLCLILVLFLRPNAPQGVRLAVPLLALAVSPLTEFISRGHSMEGQLKSILLLALLVIALVYPMTSEQDTALLTSP